MTKTGIWVGLVAIAFVAGSLLTGTHAYAAQEDKTDLISQLLQLIIDVESQVIALQTEVSQLELLPGPQGPQGPKGDTGATGPKGDDGADGTTSTYSKYAHLGFQDQQGERVVECEPGDVATGAGYQGVNREVSFRPNPLNFGQELVVPTGYAFNEANNAPLDVWIICLDVP